MLTNIGPQEANMQSTFVHCFNMFPTFWSENRFHEVLTSSHIDYFGLLQLIVKFKKFNGFQHKTHCVFFNNIDQQQAFLNPERAEGM